MLTTSHVAPRGARNAVSRCPSLSELFHGQVRMRMEGGVKDEENEERFKATWREDYWNATRVPH